jgi:NAD(P)-dependent dehydrogenase (short-subunit alcohol dehydrogenase family)
VPSAPALGAGLLGEGVVVTGGAGAIGRAVASAFAAAGARVLVTDMRAAAVRRSARALPGAGHYGVACDLRDLAAHQPLLADALERLGSLRALVHLAAVLRRRADIRRVTERDWDVQLTTNLKAGFFLCRAAAELMAGQRERGRIVLCASQGWWTGGFGGSVVYNAAKGAVVTMTRGLARTYAGRGITVNCVAPGLVDTPMLTKGLRPSLLRSLVSQVPLGRLAAPSEIAGAAVFLASDHASYVTGATLNVSGGFLMY